jgi:hypothetical protein
MPQSDKRYFFYDPNAGSPEYFATAEERDAYAVKSLDFYRAEAIDYCWSDEVFGLICGIITHRVQEVNRIDRPADLDDDGIDALGDSWEDDVSYKCEMAMVPVDKDAQSCPLE